MMSVTRLGSLSLGEGLSPSSKKRKAADSCIDATVPHVNSNGGVLISASREGLEEVRRRITTVAEETMCKWSTASDPSERIGTGESDSNRCSVNRERAASLQDLDPATRVYLRGFLAGIMMKTESMCKVTDVEQEGEAEKLMEEILDLYDDMERTTSRLKATRARVARLGATTSANTLRISKAIDDRTVAAFERGSTKSPTNDGTSPPASDVLGRGLSGLEAGALEPKVSMLIGAIAELPGPLKAVLQELPELTSSLATTVQSVEAALGGGESRTEELLGKAPPAPLARKRGVVAGIGGDRSQPPPKIVRANARETRVAQARLERAAGGAGRLGQICSS